MLINLIEIFIINYTYLFAVFGYSFLIFKVCKLERIGLINLYSIHILITFYLVICIFFIFIFVYPITKYITHLFILLGILFLLIFSRKKITYKFFFQISVIVVIASFISFYSLESDDFSYHLRAILYFKESVIEKNLINNIEDGPRVAFNSAWFLLNSFLSNKNFETSFFFVSSVLYSSLLLDFTKFLKNNYKKVDLSYLYIGFVLPYFAGVLGKYKNFGSDIPGQLIITIITFIFLRIFSLKKEIDHKIFYLLFILTLFTTMIKITNILIIFFIVFIFFKLKKKIKVFLVSSFLSIPFLIWIYSNYIISGCFIFPIEITCLDNNQKAGYYNFVVSAFAKSILNENISHETSKLLLQNFHWINYWIQDHLRIIIEKNLIYFLILTYSIFHLKIYYSKKINLTKLYLLENFNNEEKNNFILFIFVSSIQLIVWFLYFPSFRFGSVYILNIMIIIFLPIWNIFYKYYPLAFIKYLITVLSISFFYLVYRNIFKIFEYIDREGLSWPMIEKCDLLNSSSCPLIF